MYSGCTPNANVFVGDRVTWTLVPSCPSASAKSGDYPETSIVVDHVPSWDPQANNCPPNLPSNSLACFTHSINPHVRFHRCVHSTRRLSGTPDLEQRTT